jgi:hypothetical protein
MITSNVAEALPLEIIRVREILTHYEEAGQAGLVGGAFIKQSLELAEKAISDNNVVGMVVAYKDLQEIT